MKKLFVALTMFAGALAASALTVDTTVSDHCVLLQNAANIVKGKAVANSTVTVTLGGTSIGSGKTDSSGNYKVTVNPGAASFESRDLVVTDGSDTKTVADVLVGEVWLVGGQSNAFNMMDPGVMSGDYQTAYPLWKAQFNCPNVRVVISTPTQACGGVNDYYKANTSQNLRWIPCMKPNEPDIKKVSPLAFFFGKKLSEYKNCPVGILLAGNGGTPIGCHMTTEAKNRGKALTGSTVNEGGKSNFSACYSRLDTIAARGAIWAQGETDSERGGSKYRFLLQALFEDWRSASHRNDPDFPVLIYGLANFDNIEYETQNKYPRIRWEQEKAIEDGLVPYAGVFHSIDLSGSMQKGYAKSVHPDQKPELAERALLAARNVAYGENIAYRCPNPTEAYFNADRTKVIVRFPSSVTLTRDGAYTHVPFRVRNVDLDTSWGGTSVNPTDVTVGSDGHSLEIAFTGLTLNTVEYGNSVAFCNVSGTQDETLVFEQRIFDQNGFPLPPFELNIANAASGPADTHVHTWGAAAYAWSADDATCTATAACTGDSSHTATQTVAPTLTVTVEPTATTTGTGVLTAAFKAPFAVQTKTVTIPVKSATAVVPATPTAEYEGVQLWVDGPYWGTFNVGANRPTENGNFFSWGGTRDFVKGELAKFDGSFAAVKVFGEQEIDRCAGAAELRLHRMSDLACRSTCCVMRLRFASRADRMSRCRTASA